VKVTSSKAIWADEKQITAGTLTCNIYAVTPQSHKHIFQYSFTPRRSRRIKLPGFIQFPNKWTHSTVNNLWLPHSQSTYIHYTLYLRFSLWRITHTVLTAPHSITLVPVLLRLIRKTFKISFSQAPHWNHHTIVNWRLIVNWRQFMYRNDKGVYKNNFLINWLRHKPCPRRRWRHRNRPPVN
jgi:hypothetical protein